MYSSDVVLAWVKRPGQASEMVEDVFGCCDSVVLYFQRLGWSKLGGWHKDNSGLDTTRWQTPDGEALVRIKLTTRLTATEEELEALNLPTNEDACQAAEIAQICVDSSAGGNVFAIIGTIQRQLQKQGLSHQAEQFKREVGEYMNGFDDYEEALQGLSNFPFK